MTAALRYLSGFGNQFVSEAIEGSVPVGQNNPQKPPLGLYAELLSGTAFTAPRAANLRTWLYRIRPSVQVDAFEPLEHTGLSSGAAASLPLAVNPLRWLPMPIPQASEEPRDFVQGLEILMTQSQPGVVIYLMRANQSMQNQAFVDADGDLLILPQQGGLRLVTEMGCLEVHPWELALVPRGVLFRVELLGPGARAFVCENLGAAFRLPELGPIGSNGLAQPRDFLTPVAAFEADGRSRGYEIIKKFGGSLWRAHSGHSPFNVVGWHGNLVPYKYDLRRFVVLGSISVDHPDPSIFTVLTAPSDTPGVALCDLVVFPPRWMVAEHTFRPPWFHRNVMSEFMGLIEGQYDAKPEGFQPGGFSLHNSMVPHGPDAQSVEAATQSDLAPQKLDNTLAFMIESRYPFSPSRFAMQSKQLDSSYAACWASLPDRFAP